MVVRSTQIQKLTMKKLLLTACTAALISIAGLAQDQQQNRTDNNSYRSNDQNQTDTTSIGSDAQTHQDGSTDVGLHDATPQHSDNAAEDAKQSEDNVQQQADQAGDSIHEDAEQTGDAIQQGADQAGQSMREGAEKTGDAVQEGADKTGDAIREGADKTGAAIQNGAKQSGEAVQQGAADVRSTMTPNEQPADQQNSDKAMGSESKDTMAESGTNTPSMSEVEVIDSKEGPNNEVVYRFKGETFYVDRDKKELVKVTDESQLKDAKDKAIVKDGMHSQDSHKKG
jgi:hypothetical protein